MFEAFEACPGVFHIRDAIGCCMTLITGTEKAVLFDTGYGTEDVNAYVRTLTDKPVTVLLSHGHHDHALGAMYFPTTYMFSDDLPDFRTYTGEFQRRRVLTSAAQRELPVDEAAYLSAAIPEPLPLTEQVIDLGGLHVRVIHCPGHTPGSAVLHIPQRRLLLTADDWNPCTWAFFPRAMPVQVLRDNMLALTAALDFTHVLCAHQHRLFDRSDVEAFLAGLNDEALAQATPTQVPPYDDVPLLRCDAAEGQFIVFDALKYEQTKKDRTACPEEV